VTSTAVSSFDDWLKVSEKLGQHLSSANLGSHLASWP
jgi:hypothetical protein